MESDPIDYVTSDKFRKLKFSKFVRTIFIAY